MARKQPDTSAVFKLLRRALVNGPRVLVFLSVAIGVGSIILRNGKTLVEDCRKELAELLTDDVRKMFNLGKPGSKVEEEEDEEEEEPAAIAPPALVVAPPELVVAVEPSAAVSA